MVDDYKALRLGVRVSRLVADMLFEFDDLLDFGIRKAAFGFDKLLALFGRGIEKARIDLTKGEPNQSFLQRSVD